jgi:serine/threonine protein kinase
MERPEGESLRDRLKRASQRSPLWWVVSIGVQLCASIEMMHQNQITRRDLKPSNIFLQRRFLG